MRSVGGDDLLVELGFAGLFDAGVQVADVGGEGDDGLAVNLEHEAEHAVCGRVLRPHIDDHGLVGDGVAAVLVAFGIGDDVFDAGIDLVGSGDG
jgi:hypothetical protein